MSQSLRKPSDGTFEENVRFLKGHIEEIPLPNDTVDVIISNCVINLSADKDQVLREAFRYLGVPYRWGGNGGQGIDCSGLVRNVFARCGIALPRTAHEQARVGAPAGSEEGRTLFRPRSEEGRTPI